MAGDPERTEPATDRRRREAREAGQVARSPEVLTAFVLGSGALGLWLGAGHALDALAALASEALQFERIPHLSASSALALAHRAVTALAQALLPLFLALVAGAVAGGVVQVGLLVSFQPLTPTAERIDPFRGFRNLFARATLFALLRDLLKVAVVGAMAYVALRPTLPGFPYWANLAPRDLLARLLLLAFSILKHVWVAFAAIALFDYGLQRWQHEVRLRMTRREVEDEQRETEGDPTIRNRARNLQRELARRRMMAGIDQADVVVVDPTRFAVALGYERGSGEAPRVLAKGEERVAERIVGMARRQGVPLYEDASVARGLYRSVALGDRVPPEFFPAVAEILASVYRATGQRRSD